MTFPHFAHKMVLIWEELGPKFMDLLEMGRSGVIASLIAASQRLHSHEHEVYNSNFITFFFSYFTLLFLFVILKLLIDILITYLKNLSF